MNEIKSQLNPEIKAFLIGNKTDLEEKRQISHLEYKDRDSRNGLMAPSPYQQDLNMNVNNIMMDDEGEKDRPKKKKKCRKNNVKFNIY